MRKVDGDRAQVPLWLIAVIAVAISLSAIAAVIVIKRLEKKPSFDFGDAPDPTYPSLLASNGARHADITRAWFGDNVNAEVDARVPDLDNFDDGLIFADPIVFEVTNNNWPDNLFVNILIDNNRDGDWSDLGEWVVQNTEVNVPPGQSEAFETEVSLPPRTWMRMTLTGEPLTNYVGTGEFKIGETEDHYYENAHAPPEPCWFNIELEPEEQSVPHGEEVSIRIVLSPLSTSVPEVNISRVAAGVLYPPFLGLPQPAEVEGVPPDIEVPEPIGIPAPNPVRIPNLRIDPPGLGDTLDTLGWIRFDTVFDLPERIEVIEITIRGETPQRVDLETAEISVYHHQPVHFLELSVDSPKTAGQSSAITVRAYDAENNPASGASISLTAQAMENQFAGDYKIELSLTDAGNGTYTSNLISQWAGTYRLTASIVLDHVSTRGNVVFEPGPPVDIVATATSPTPVLSSYKSTVTFYFADAYGNSLPPDRVQPTLSLPAGWSRENLQTSYTGESFFDVFVDNWDNNNITITDNMSELSENFNLAFLPLYTEVEQDLSPTSLELISPSPENVEARATWGDNRLSLKVGVFFPAMSELGSYEMTFSYDSSAIHLIEVRDWDTTDGFPAPTLTVVGEGSFKISQTGSAPPGGVNLAIVDFEPLKTGATNVTATNLKLSKVEYTPVYDHMGNIIYYEKIYVPIEVPTPFGTHITVLKPLKRLIVPVKKWIVEDSGITEADVRSEFEKVEEAYHKAAKECKFDYWIIFIVEINQISKEEWDKKAGADGKLSPSESKNLFKQNNWNPDGWMNVYNVPSLTDEKGENEYIGWWWNQYDGNPGIFTDKSKDLHNRNLIHEFMHEFSKSAVKDSPADNAEAQGGRDPNNVMRYCGGGKEISGEQGEIINGELDKRAEQYDADGDGTPDGYIYKPKK